MTTAARVNADTRMVAAGLATNEAVIRPGTITATGRAAPSQFAIMPSGYPASFALLAHVDYHDVPDFRPGGGFVGGRISSIVPYLDPAAIAAPADVRVVLKQLPSSRDEIGRRLREEAGLWWAPGALFSLVGWEDDWVAIWLDRLRKNGPDAMLIIAHAQAQLALRKMWFRIAHGAGAPPAGLSNWWPSLSTQCGAVAVARALLDAAAMLFRLIDSMRDRGQSLANISAPMRKIKLLVETFVYYVEDADHRSDARARSKLMRAIKAARSLLDGVAVFSVAPEALHLRWSRLDSALFGTSLVTATPFLQKDLAAFEARLNRLSAASLGNRLQATVWRNHIRRSLLRLASPDPAVRIARLDRVRADLLYKLAMTGRLDRLYRLFPWLAAPHGAFVNCAGGALGALASLIECARRMQIAREQKRELGDVLDDETFARQRAAVERLTIPAARALWRSEVRMAAASGHGYVAGMALEHGAFSHATVTAMIGGAYFSPDFPLTAARFGKLGWSLPVALQDPRTVASVRAIEQGRPIMQKDDHDDDLPRCNGMTLKRQLAETIVSVFPTGSAGKKGPARRARAVHAAAKAGRPGEGAVLSAMSATNQLLRSMLVSLETPVDDHYRDAIADNVVPTPLLTGEAARVEGQQTQATRNSVDCDVSDAGQGMRNKAVNERSMRDERYALLRQLAYDAAHWREPNSAAAASESLSEDLLEDILRGRADLAQLTPVGALPLPILWFAPLIDRERVHWIANGAPVAHPPAGPAAQRDGIALAVARAHAWAPLLYSNALLTGHSVDVACALFTGRSPVTADLGLAYSVR
ncbi:MAG: hypothetical protein V4459_00755 [Pseudomonadota bacterium]